MKAKRRQELKTNDLAQVIDGLSQFFRKWGTHMVAGVGAVIVVMIIIAYLRSTKSSALDAAFAEMNSALQIATTSGRRSDEEIKRGIQRTYQIADGAGDAAFKCDALMQGANLAIQLATRENELNPEFLPEARQGFERIVKEHKDQTLYYGRALFGLFQVEANQFAVDGDPAHRAAAARYLETIRDDARFTSTPLGTMALNQLNAIDEIFTTIEFASAPPKPTATAPATAPAATTQPAIVPEVKIDPAEQVQPVDSAPPEEASPSPTTQPAESPADSEPTPEAGDEGADGDDAASPIP